MNDRDLVRLGHMLACCDNIFSFIKGKRKTQLTHDILLNSAIRHQLEILGEAANAITEKTKESFQAYPGHK